MPRGSAPPRPLQDGARARLRRAAAHAAVGALLGYGVLHPVAMAVFRALDAGPASEAGAGILLRAAAESFHPHMLPMGAVFAAVLAVAGAADGWLRGTVLDQRRELARLVRRLERRNVELERLHALQRRSTRFLVHDLKTHIGCIQGFAELLRTSPVVSGDPEAADAAVRISRQAGKLLAAVTDLLELSRLEEEAAPDRRPVPVRSLFHELEELFAAEVRGGRLRIEPPADGALAILGDARLLLRVLGNLVTNALEHGPDGTHVEIAARPAPDRPGWVELSCADAGPGIPPGELPHVFEEFRSGRGSSGLGLAFCKAAVEAHGGAIRCDNRRGGGCTFTVLVPAAPTTGDTT